MAIAALATADLSAHDFWLAATNWTPAAGAPITITAGLGERFPTRTDFKPYPEWFDEWRVVGASGDILVSKMFQRSELTMDTDVRLLSPGAYMGVMDVRTLLTNMMADEFTGYLEEEGLDWVIAARKAAGETDKPARELYARYAKIALRNGDGSGTHLTKPAGLKAELVPTTDPTLLRPGGSLTVQFLADGKPVVGSEVTAVTDGSSVKGRTDGEGRVTLKVDREGAWLIRAVQMVRLPEAGAVAEWESFWVTLSFHTARR
jgi:hypothetical protein